MPVVASPRTARATEFRMRQWTRSARKQFLALTPKHQVEVAEHIAEAIPAYLCRPVYNLDRFKVYHFHASDTLVVSYVLRAGGEGCIVHIGTHPEFDHFADHYTGSAPAQIIPIDENDMHKKPSLNGHAPKAVPNLPAGRPAPSAAPVVTPADPLKLAFLDLLKPVVAKETEGFTDELLKLIGRLDGFTKQLDVVQTNFAAHVEVTSAASGQAVGRVAEVADLVTGLRQSLEAAIAGVNERITGLFSESDRRVADHAKALESQLAAVTAAVEQVRTTDHTLAVRTTLEAVRLQVDAAHRLIGQQSEEISAAAAREQQTVATLRELGQVLARETAARLAADAERERLATAVAALQLGLAAQAEASARKDASRPFARIRAWVHVKLCRLIGRATVS